MITIGVDEVGRGCWAGPLVAGAVALARPVPGLRDSKKLSIHQREQLYKEIEKNALAIGLGWVWSETIDKYGITWSVKWAMQQAYEMLLAELNGQDAKVIVDGRINYLDNVKNSQAVVKADDSVPAVSAASIIAKVARDRYMATIANEYPNYGFERHVGYGTAQHIAALKQHGVTDIHRRSYKPIQAILELKTYE